MRRWLSAIEQGLGWEGILGRSGFGGLMFNSKRPFPTRVFQDFSKQELQNFLEILHYALEAETEQDVTQVLVKVRKLIPYENIIATLLQVGSSTGAQQFSKVINVSYPEEWLSAYAKNRYYEVDPVLLAHLQSFSTQVWQDAFKSASTRKEMDFIDHAKSFDLEDGVTTGSLDPGKGYATLFSFAGGASGDGDRYAPVLDYLVHHLHQTLVRNAMAPTLNRVARLSPRELSVLNWMRLGKTNWEISRILGVSERTVRFHVESIFNKLDVSSRTQAVALAVENGLLMPA